MKFELTDLHKQITDLEIINDLRQVANNLGKTSLKIRDYVKNNGALYSYQTAKKRFGNWEAALAKAELKTENSIHGIKYGETSINSELLLADIKRVAEELNNSKITLADYEKFGKYGGATIHKRFGGWNKAKQAANLEIGRIYNTTTEQYLQNILELWTHYGRQPKYAEVVSPFSKYHVSSYERKFGTWRAALEQFIEFVNSDTENSEEQNLIEITGQDVPNDGAKLNKVKVKRTPRSINLRLRWTVLKRDNFTCKKCGSSPAKDQTIELNVDHIIPWSKNGETVLDNLETLCTNCNLGKSNLL
ncbi:homing endonuclease associated repeat-containing protein [Pinibacter soli]|uniref:HNH endonuclease n=1 Tax=Pinibacter soli TaxID=3044211 RepID=A0ABT6R7D7_9BACT|nr:HNH endonuclease [Pinibacter soli]MDI3318285.1 HNH endonuclease [Pinibacter soli]